MAVERNLLQLQKSLQGFAQWQMVLIAHYCHAGSLSCNKDSELLASPAWDPKLTRQSAASHVPALGLWEAAEGKMPVTEDVELELCHCKALGFFFPKGQIAGKWKFLQWQVKNPHLSTWIHWGKLAEVAAIHKTWPAKLAVRFIPIPHWEGPASAEEPQLAGWHLCQNAFSKR